MNFHTAELFVCPPYHQKIVCGEDPVIFLIIILGGLSKRERVGEEGIEQLSLVQRRKRGREGGEEEREREILYQIFQGDVWVLFIGGIVGEPSKTVAHTGTRHLRTCGRRTGGRRRRRGS